MKNKYIMFISLIISLSFIFVGCKSEKQNEYITQTDNVFDTFFTSKLLGHDDVIIFSDMNKYLSDLELKYSTKIYNSDVSKFNRLKQTREFPVSKEVIDLIDTAYYYCTIADGGYDFSIEPVISAWNFENSETKMPDRDLLLEALSHVNYKNIKINAEDSTLKKLDPDAMINLDSLAKGYALDNLVSIVKENEISNGILNLGNHIYAMGNDKDVVGWTIEIPTPSKDISPEALGYINITNNSVVIKSIYDGYYEKNGIIFHNVFDVKTGYPTNNGIESVIVIAPKAIDADALSSVFFTIGTKESLQLASILDQVELILVTKEKTIYATKKIGDIFIQNNSEYTVIKNVE
jgi:thiamine biosynthesis lipoprotein